MKEIREKYKELQLTGNIPQNPNFLYEYELPDDMGEDLAIMKFGDRGEYEKSNDYELCLNLHNQPTLICNYTPVVLYYKPKRTYTIDPVNINSPCFPLQVGIVQAILKVIYELEENNFKPKCIYMNEKIYTVAEKPLHICGYPVHLCLNQSDDFTIGV